MDSMLTKTLNRVIYGGKWLLVVGFATATASPLFFGLYCLDRHVLHPRPELSARPAEPTGRAKTPGDSDAMAFPQAVDGLREPTQLFEASVAVGLAEGATIAGQP